MARNTTQITPVALKGGLNLASPALSAQPGECRVLHNYVCDVLGQYERIEGFHRVDGTLDLLDHSFLTLVFDEDLPAAVIEQLQGQRISDKKKSASGVVLHSYKNELVLVDVQGTFQRGDLLDHITVEPYTVQRAYVNGSSHPISVTQTYRHLTQSYFRSDITPVPGTGPIRGVAYYNNELLAWRDNDAGTETIAWRATPTGWSPVPTVPPRIYEPPFEYDYLVFAGQAGADFYEDPTNTASIGLARSFRRGYFSLKIGYGDLLLPRPGAEAERVKEISYYHTTTDTTVLCFDPGEDLGDFGALDVYVEDQPMYRFLWHEARENDDKSFSITREGTAYLITLPKAVELWDARQRVGFMFHDFAEVPAPPPDPDQWAFSPPSSVVEGETLTFAFVVTRSDGTPVPNASLTWMVDGIDSADLSSGDLQGNSSTDANGRLTLEWTFEVDGLDEAEAFHFQGTTSDGTKVEAIVQVTDEQLSEASHTYTITGPSQIVQGGKGNFVITVVNKLGERVADQDIDWRVTGMTTSSFYMPRTSGTITTDGSGQAVVEVGINNQAAAYTAFAFEITSPVSQSLGSRVGRKESTPAPSAPPPSSSTPAGGTFWMSPATKYGIDDHVFGHDTVTHGWNTYRGGGQPSFGSASGTTFADVGIRGIALIESLKESKSGFHVVLGRTSTNRLSSVTVKLTLEYVDTPSSRKRLTTLTSTPSNSSMSADGAFRFTFFRKSTLYFDRWNAATGMTLVSVEVS